MHKALLVVILYFIADCLKDYIIMRLAVRAERKRAKS